MQTILFDILLILTVVWLLVGILFLWQQLHIVRQRIEEESEKKNKQKQKQSTSSVTQDQVEQARQVLVGKSKSYRERYDEISKEITTNSQKSLMFPILHQKKNQLIILIPLQGKTHLCPKRQKKRKVQKRTMKYRLTTQWTSLTKTLSFVRNCKSLMQ